MQRDLLPIVEGTTVNTKHGPVKTDHILFVAAGAFHRSKPADLMPELQGRFPIRVEMHDLTRDDFARILREPRASLLRQYQALLAHRGSHARVYRRGDRNHGRHRLSREPIDPEHRCAAACTRSSSACSKTLSFDASDRTEKHVVIDEAHVRQRLESLSQDEDLSRFIL